jgi:CRP-like cAMP-binding protein
VFIYTQRAIRELVHLRLSNKRRTGCKQLADRLGGKSRRRVRFFPIRTSCARDKPLNVEIVFGGKFETPQRSAELPGNSTLAPEQNAPSSFVGDNCWTIGRGAQSDCEAKIALRHRLPRGTQFWERLGENLPGSCRGSFPQGPSHLESYLRGSTDRRYPGDLIGLGSKNEHMMNAQAVKPTRLRCLPIGALYHSASNDPALGFKLYEALARELAATRDLMLTTGQRSAMERVVSFLLAFSRRSARNGQDPLEFELPMTRGDIGDFLGLTIETVSRTFSKLKALGLIELAQSNRVKLGNIDELRSIAEGEDH